MSAARALCAAAFLLCMLGGGDASAHTRSTSYSSFDFDGAEVRVRLRIAQLELTRLPWGTVHPPAPPAGLAAYLPNALRLVAEGSPCDVIDAPRALQAPAGLALLEWRLQCPPGAALVLHSDLLRETTPGHLHFVRVRFADGEVTERVLGRRGRTWPLSPGIAGGAGEGTGDGGATSVAPGASDGMAPGDSVPGAGPQPVGASMRSYIVLGITHITGGIDHLAFLSGLLLMVTHLRALLFVLTGFTLAHSITLALAATGRLTPEAAAVEALIGLSIALVAFENAWLRSGQGFRRAWPARVFPLACIALALASALGVGVLSGLTWLGLALFSACYFPLTGALENPLRLRIAIACCFGLVHGFGFAGFLGEMNLPAARLLPALFAFNIGIEVGQLLFALPAVALLALLRRFGAAKLQNHVLDFGNAALSALGVFWLVERGFFSAAVFAGGG